MTVEVTPSPTAALLRHLNLGLVLALIAVVFGWQLSIDFTWPRALVALLLTLPLWAPLPGIARARRRTYAWATLCVIPSFILGITEAVANPAMRLWSGACLALALVLFVTLIGYLRVTRVKTG
jgi:uncharacterized membrane protein